MSYPIWGPCPDCDRTDEHEHDTEEEGEPEEGDRIIELRDGIPYIYEEGEGE
jgi:hypothetical protein